MDTLVGELVSGFVRTASVADDVRRFFGSYRCHRTTVHSAEVAAEATRLGRRFGVDVDRATTAAWLHDISAVIPNSQRVACALALGVEVLDEESSLPMILHQKLSAALAEKMVGIHDSAVLNAVRFHTTLHPDADALAKVVFVADKIAWDRPGHPPYLADLIAALDHSLDAGVCAYLGYLWDQRRALPVVHPWFVAAYTQLCVPAGGMR